MLPIIPTYSDHMLYVYIDMYDIHPCNKMFIVKVPSSIIASNNKETMAVILIG